MTTTEKANEAGATTPTSSIQPLPNATSAFPLGSCTPDSTPGNGDQQAIATENPLAVRIRALREKKEAEEAAKLKAQGQATLPYLADIEELKANASRPNGAAPVVSDYGRAVDEACASITFEEIFESLQSRGIIQATVTPVRQWRGDSNKFSCPNPAHPDTNPSAWGSRDKANSKGSVGVWRCDPCDTGGDKYDLASYMYGLDRRGQFNDLCERMARDFRGVLKPQPAAPVAIVEQPAPILDPVEPERVSPVHTTTFDWRQVLSLSPANREGSTTFLWEWCKAVEPDTTPTEYNLFTGLMAVGLVAGNDLTSPDFKPLSANFGMCFVARSGAGKSRATEHMTNMLKQVRPGNKDGTGVHIHGTVFSGQEMIRMLDHREADPSDPKAPPIPVPQRALFEYPELSDIAAGGGIQGSILKAKMHDALDHKPEMQYSSGQMGGKISAIDPFASIVTTTQTKRIRDLLRRDDAASGFMNRFLFLMGTEKKQLARGKVPLDFTSADLELTKVRWHAGTVRSLEWDDDASDHWEKVFDTVVEPLQKADTHDILTRLDLNLKRIMLAFAVNERTTSIQRHHVEMAEALIPYLVTCYEQVLGALLNTEDREICEWLLEKALDLEHKARAKNPKNMTPGPSQADLRRYYGKKGWPDWKVTRALKSLEDAGLILAVEAAGTRGGKTNRYYTQQ